MANNPYVNKVQLANGTTLIDITDTTATASDVASGKTFYLATGERATGTSSGGSYLPSTYRAVEYLQSDGSQWFDSGVECTSDLDVDFKAKCLTDVNAAMCGGINTTSNPIYFRHHFSPATGTFSYWLQNNSTAVPSIIYETDPTGIFTLKINAPGGRSLINETQLITFTPVSSKTTGQGYGIFARISNTGATQSRPSRIYWFKLSRNFSLLRNFIPCVRMADSKPGMYDTVTETFYTNAGTGEFTVPGGAT